MRLPAVGCVFWLASAVQAAVAPPVYTRDIAPIIQRHCAVCHRPGETAPFPLLTYSDVKKRAAQIATVTRSRFMPPWLPEAGHGDFAGELRLSDAEIRAIGEWAAQGAPEGTPSAVGSTLPPAAAPLGAPDLRIQAATSFTVPASGPDVYWNFVLKPALSATRFVRAVEILPGDRRLVHHANLMVDRTGSAHLRETAPGRGFPGMELTVMRSPFDPEGHFRFWKPGSPPRIEPDGLAWRLDPGDELVLNAHFHPTGKAEAVRPAIALYFTAKPPTKFPLLLQLENDPALDIPPGAPDFVVSDDFRLPMDLDVLAVYPHAHALGKLLEAYATLPDGKRQWLIRIPAWDPNWQAVFDYRQPLFLPRGSVVSMRYHYDNSAANIRNPSHPPKRVRSGNQATDEMAHLWLQVLPRGPGDRRRELQEAFFRHRLETEPRNFEANLNLGAVLLSRLSPQQAVGYLRAAVEAAPRRADARNMLGVALAATGQSVEAIEQFRTALRQQPGLLNARFNLANALVKSGKLDEAIADYRQVVSASGADVLPRSRLADALLRAGRRDDALEQFRQILRIDPANREARQALHQQ